jgi:hypothetical protein
LRPDVPKNVGSPLIAHWILAPQLKERHILVEQIAAFKMQKSASRCTKITLIGALCSFHLRTNIHWYSDVGGASLPARKTDKFFS